MPIFFTIEGGVSGLGRGKVMPAVALGSLFAIGGSFHYMERIGYKKMFTQKVQHENFRNKLEALDLESIDENQEQAIEDLLKFVTDWLVEHIMGTDKQIGEFNG